MRSVKRWVYEVMRPDRSDRFAAHVFATVVSALIVISVALVFLTTFELPEDLLAVFWEMERVIVIAFTVEYALRIWTADVGGRGGRFNWLTARFRYVLSPMAIIDLLAILPFYLPLLLPPGLIGIRVLRLLRLVRVFKVTRQFRALAEISAVLREKAKDLLAVFFFMSLIVVFLSLLMYAAEHDAQPDSFRNAASALWWALETFTKSGSHGMHPVTLIGRVVGMLISVMGICLIAIPTGIVTSGLTERLKTGRTTRHDKTEG